MKKIMLLIALIVLSISTYAQIGQSFTEVFQSIGENGDEYQVMISNVDKHIYIITKNKNWVSYKHFNDAGNVYFIQVIILNDKHVKIAKEALKKGGFKKISKTKYINYDTNIEVNFIKKYTDDGSIYYIEEISLYEE
jgi:competence protein ComGC